jgi:ferredoxin
VRTTAQLLLLAVAAIVVVHGLAGPQLAPKNLATVLTWVHYRGLLIGVLIAIGNAFCGACPMILLRDLGRRLHAPARAWPRKLRNKWCAIGLFAAILFSYELFDWWALPAATAWLVAGYFAAALAVDLVFTGAAFCKYVCPVGQFNFMASTLSPFEVRARRPSVCAGCRTADCIAGRRDEAAPARILRRGCELGLFVPSKIGNLDCTFCLDCIQACPHDNIAIGLRVPGEELADDRRRSAIGRLSQRTDVAALALLFTSGAVLNAFAMTSPVYAVEEWLAGATGFTSEAPVLGLMFLAALAVIPAGLCGAAAALTRRLAHGRHLAVGSVAVRYAFALVPLGVGLWAAHYSFHFLTAAGTIVPVTQSAAIDLAGRALAGEPDWGWLGLRPGAVFPAQAGMVLLGMLGSLTLVQRISERDFAERPLRASAPWHVLVVGLAALTLWILLQPMEMRGTGIGG